MSSRLRTIEGESFVTRMAFDASDRPVSLTYPDSMVITYTYNAFGVLDSIPGYVDALDYTAAGQLQTLALANGLTTRHSFDLRQRLLTLETTGYGKTYQSLSYRYDGASNILAITDHRPDRTLENDMTAVYTYDSLYRLTSDRTTVGQTLYDHDGIGNIISQTSTAPEARLNLGAIAHGQNAGPHAPTTVGADLYTYDANGNLTAKPGLLLAFDYRDRLISATTVSGAHLTFLYDANNIRLLKRVQYADGSESVVYYPDQYSEVRDGEVVNYVWAGERRMAQIGNKSDAVYFFHFDHLNSTNSISDQSGQIAEEVTYYSYGVTRKQTGAMIAYYAFTGKEWDIETQLYYFEARYYEPRIAAFISADPFYIKNPQDDGEKPQVLNLYGYVLRNPLKYIDPNGQTVYLVTRKLDDDGIIAEIAVHSFLIVIPDRPQDFGGEKMWTYGAYDVNGKLVAMKNGPDMTWFTDDKPLKGIEEVKLPDGMTDTKFIEKLQDLHNYYSENEMSYLAASWIPWTSGVNCNNYTTYMLAGAYVPMEEIMGMKPDLFEGNISWGWGNTKISHQLTQEAIEQLKQEGSLDSR